LNWNTHELVPDASLQLRILVKVLYIDFSMIDILSLFLDLLVAEDPEDGA
jgi:hypothetical protein